MAERINPVVPPRTEGQAAPGSRRDRIAVFFALATVVCLIAAFILSKGTQLLMPGPLASAHGAIENCGACHTKSGTGKLSWVHGLVAGDPEADSKACLTCHKMPETAFNAHSASLDVLERSTQRLLKVAAGTPAPQSARAQSAAFPTDDVIARGLYCATCHQEHQGANFSLNKISNEQCRSCHVVKFDSFDGHHPKFEDYPFKRRTRIIYDHAGHFGKHYPEVAKKDPEARIPDTCSTCHSSRDDKRVMAVAPFEQTCTSCHLDQILGKERASGPKGVAFLTLPGLDLQTLKKKNASIGEWPDGSEAELTPFMKVMIGRDERGRALLNTVNSLNLQDLSSASDDQIKAVTSLAWEIKGLFYALIAGKASDVLADLNIGGGAKLSANLVADLTASIPRDVLISAHQEWLPNLATEMANRPAKTEPVATNQEEGGWSTVTAPEELSGKAAQIDALGRLTKAPEDEPPKASAPQPEAPAATTDTETAKPENATPDAGEETRSAESPSPAPAEPSSDASESAEKQSTSEDTPATPASEPDAGASKTASKAIPNQQACVASIFGQCVMFKGQDSQGAAGQADTQSPKPEGSSEQSPPEQLPLPMQAGLKELVQVAQAEGPAGKAGNEEDDLLFPTEEELRALKSGKGAAKSAQPEGAPAKSDAADTKPDSNAEANAPADTPAASPDSDAAAAAPQAKSAPVISIQSDVDPESWAEYGGWYRQDYAIFYRPTGHKDKFIYSWLFLTGPQAPRGDAGAAAAVFDYLTGKEAQGACTKCHSVDDIPGKGRLVNFTPPSAKTKQGRFTNFIHEPHFGVMESRTGIVDNRGCLTCHELEKGRPYLKSYEQGNPQEFLSNFGAVKKDLCQTCHTATMARQDCLLCHKYHVDGVVTPIINTKIPSQ